MVSGMNAKCHSSALNIFCPTISKLNLCSFCLDLRLLFILQKYSTDPFKNYIKYLTQIACYLIPYSRASLHILERIDPGELYSEGSQRAKIRSGLTFPNEESFSFRIVF